ncbi:hypothetical protein [Mycetocola zhujimingii]|uniref:hypothetical protein n=1 Tax=Mycetocola zhujimingii TaxID=2079792 RepID=UPI000D3D4EB7|nr:hypothetical protein [Mycetocola zhujimingii]AWB88136.1 hypothetical protein C3E77_15275 [Mycetocola zhujimingii]
MKQPPLIVLALATIALTGCASPTAADRGPEAQPTRSATATTPPPVGGTEGDLVPTTAPAAEEAAAQAAVVVVETFGQPELTADAWMEAMYPVLSPKGATAYLHTDPANIPVTAVTGDPTVLTGLTATYAIVDVPTNAGVYTVTLTRDDENGAWLAERIRPKQS